MYVGRTGVLYSYVYDFLVTRSRNVFVYAILYTAVTTTGIAFIHNLIIPNHSR